MTVVSRPSVLLLIDERKGSKSAETLGIPFVGSLGLLVKGHLNDHLDFETALNELRNTTFHLGESAILFARIYLSGVLKPSSLAR